VQDGKLGALRDHLLQVGKNVSPSAIKRRQEQFAAQKLRISGTLYEKTRGRIGKRDVWDVEAGSQHSW
jgi:hypothetical protein